MTLVHVPGSTFIGAAVLGAAFTIGSVGCTVNAPPAEDLSGEAIAVKDGRLQIDDTIVPVVPGCVEGQVVTRAADGWACVDVTASTITAGDGLTGGGAGAVSLAVDFGDGATDVASGARVVAVETATAANTADLVDVDVDLTALDGRLTTAETAAAALTGRVAEVETLELTDLYQQTCTAGGAGGLSFQNGGLFLCDGAELREVQVAPSTAPAVIADFDTTSFAFSTGRWSDKTGGEAFGLGSDVGSVSPAPGPGVAGLGRLAGGAAAGITPPLGQVRMTLPARNFSLEVVMIGTETIISHGTQLQLQSFGGTEIMVREFNRETRFTLPVGFVSDAPNHYVYVHEADDVRRLYINGVQTVRVADSTFWRGPYLGGTAILSLGSQVGAGGAGAGPTYYAVRVHGVALSASAVSGRCQAFRPSIVSTCN